MQREEFFAWLWRKFAERGLLGVHEGTVLSEQAAAEGEGTESWTVDAGEAPRERDWIATVRLADAELYFATREQASEALAELRELAGLVFSEAPLEEQLPEDWDAKWKREFTGIEIGPWKVIPPWKAGQRLGTRDLVINPGAGFGTGTHETTQLCLQAIAVARLGQPAGNPWRALDFGSGSGILSIALARLGAEVDGVEIDELAIDNAVENAKLNATAIRFSRFLEEGRGPYDLVVANILRPVLLEFAERLCARRARGGALVLSGLVATDVPEVSVRFSALLGREPSVHTLGDWRALVWAGA
jgi:ribosomal protein L11 methyltransferase